KARQGEEYCEFQTTEYRNGIPRREAARFRKFPSLAACFARHGELLATLPRYGPAMACASDPLAFALELQRCGYATDPKYPAKLAAIIGQYNLTQYDRRAT
ncbi:MAG: glycoside hydrolase family 73 protein, partial [Terriglobales bacterium]